MATTAKDEMVRTHVVLPKSLVEQIDARAGARHRSEFIAEVMTEWLRRLEMVDAAEAFAGSLKDVDTPGWNTPEETSAWVRASRALDDKRWREKWGIE
jgi:Arc/MetJ-type ribon-helix-helix transcriptional regulator